MNVSDFVARLEYAKETPNGWEARCPAHDDKHASLCIHQEGNNGEQKILLKCQAGCDTKAILAAMGLGWGNLFEDSEKKRASTKRKPRQSQAPTRTIIATYEYTDASGNLAYQVQRTDDKQFIQRRREVKDNAARWVYNIQGVTRVLYRLPSVIAAIQAGEPIYIVEGEKDVATLEAWGLVATTNSGGASAKWLDSYTATLTNADVVIIPDNDDPGRKHAEDVGQSLLPVAKRVRVVTLPDLTDHGDVTDWKNAGGTPEQLAALVSAAPDFTPHSVYQTYTTPEHIAHIDIHNQPLRSIGRASIDALRAQNEPPYLFHQRGAVVRFRETETGIPVIEQVDESILAARLADIADFTTDGQQGLRHHNPPRDAVRYILASDGLKLPALTAVTESPLLRADGTILQQPGYDLATGYLYRPVNGFVMPDVPKNPTTVQVTAATQLIQEVFCDFPFVDEASRANTIALMITPLLRTIVPKSPLALIDATKWGTGKSLLAEACATVSAGTFTLTTAPSDGEEWRKKITSLLSAGKPYVIIDNVKKTLESDALAALLTSTTWTDRVLGGSTTTSLPNNAVWVATGNNVQTDGEIARRSYLIQIDAETSAPQERDVSQFRHPDLMQWVACERGAILAALFTIIRAWIVAGRPTTTISQMGSFETWTATVGSILAFAGIPAFLGNKDTLMVNADSESAQWEAFLARWVELYEHYPQTVAEIKHQLISTDGFEGCLPEQIAYAIKGESVNTHRVGRALKSKEGTRFGRMSFKLRQTGIHHQATLWTVDYNKLTGDLGELGESGTSTPVRKKVISTHDNTLHMGDPVPGTPQTPTTPPEDEELF